MDLISQNILSCFKQESTSHILQFAGIVLDFHSYEIRYVVTNSACLQLFGHLLNVFLYPSSVFV